MIQYCLICKKHRELNANNEWSHWQYQFGKDLSKAQKVICPNCSNRVHPKLKEVAVK